MDIKAEMMAGLETTITMHRELIAAAKREVDSAKISSIDDVQKAAAVMNSVNRALETAVRTHFLTGKLLATLKEFAGTEARLLAPSRGTRVIGPHGTGAHAAGLRAVARWHGVADAHWNAPFGPLL